MALPVTAPGWLLLREQRIQEILRNNPSLSREEAVLVFDELYVVRGEMLSASCCPCYPTLPQIVTKPGGKIGPCTCGCHTSGEPLRDLDRRK